jgi:DNA adenine methylase
VLSHGGGRGVLRHGEHDDAVKVSSERPLLTGNGEGCGVTKVSLTRQIDDLAGDSGAVGRGIVASGFDLRTGGVYAYMHALATRLRRVRVCCGDWGRVVTPAAVFLDPPYHAPGTERSAVYTHDTDTIWRETRDWAVANGDNPELRIALCGYEGDHEIPDSWECVEWKASGGYGRSARGRANRDRERIWFSPHCLSANAVQHSLDLDGVVA